MSMVKLTLPDGSIKELDNPTGLTLAQSIGARLAKDALAIEVDGKLQDLSQEITKDAHVKILTFRDDAGKKLFWHSSAHILAIAIKRIYPKALLTIGPAIETGFYYDIANIPNVKSEDLEKIEEQMQKVIQEDTPFVREEIDAKKAKELFKDNKYKLEIIKEKGESLTLYHNKDFFDLCSGPHIPSTGYVSAFKLTKTSSAYWRADENNDSLQRIYGVSYPDKKDLKKYLEMLEEASKRDHRKLGQKLDLFTFSELVGPGLPLYTPKGAYLRNAIISLSKELNQKLGFKEVHTPNINKAELFKISGHYDKYKEDMFKVSSNYSKEEYFLKPMNCPQHTQIYASQSRSYRDLPIRYSDFANLHRDEKPGELGGLSRLRCFCQDDGHSFCRMDQVKSEFSQILKVINEALTIYQLTPWFRLSLRDTKEKEKYLGDDALWQQAETTLKELVKENKLECIEAEGEAAFYGPKLDVMAKDVLGRNWQISTIQLDFNMPTRFKLAYVDESGKDATPVMIHRALIGSPERFMSILIEHFAGKFPLWLSPNQVMIVPVADRFMEYANEVAEKLILAGIRVDIDERSEGVSKKVRDAQMQYYNYVLVVGENEVAEKIVAVRNRAGELENLAYKDFVKRTQKELLERT